MELVDENTICVATILGSTLNGEFDSMIFYLLDTPIHVDIASGGFIAPFIYPELEWDFRLPLVKSLKWAQVWFGVCWNWLGYWRSKEDLPEEIIFHINYLGADQSTFTLNFSKGSSQVIAQYYQLIRLGFEGYRNMMENCRDNMLVLKEGLEKTGWFDIVSKDNGVPLVAFTLKDHTHYDEFQISNMQRRFGWIVPAYTMSQMLNMLQCLVLSSGKTSQEPLLRVLWQM